MADADCLAEASDDELSKSYALLDKNGDMNAQYLINDLFELYSEIKKSEILELKWKFPGRRSPSEMTEQEELNKDDDQNVILKEEGNKKEQKNDFDFDDDFGDSQPPVTQVSLSTKKKPAQCMYFMHRAFKAFIISYHCYIFISCFRSDKKSD